MYPSYSLRLITKFDALKTSTTLLIMYKVSITFLIFAFVSLQSYSQAPAAPNSADIFLQIKKLNVLGSVLYIAAHPDDENTRLLAYFSKEKLYRTGYMSLTRGDGGQNLIGDEQGIELGLIRTQELLSARRIDGAEQFFGTAYDFGFSKNATEALRIWDHDKMLSDVVWVIRLFQPDVIITRFPPDERAGHGHHWASSILAAEAFTTAADSTKFKEQFKYGVKPWQAKRIFWNTYNFGGNNTTSSTQLTMDIGAFNPLLGKGYGEIAAESRSQHKSQGFGSLKQRGQATEYFSLTNGSPASHDVMDGVNTTWQRISGGNYFQAMIDDIISHYNFEHPENSVDSLVKLYNTLQNFNLTHPGNYWGNRKLNEVKNIIAECEGLFMEATTNQHYAITGDTMAVSFSINKRNNGKTKLQEVELDNYDTAVNQVLSTNKNVIVNTAFPVRRDKPLYQPYWLQNPHLQGSFIINNQLLIGKPENDADYSATFTVSIDTTMLHYVRPVMYKYADPIKGEVYEPVHVITPFVISATPGIALVNVKPQEGKAPEPQLKITLQSNINVPQLPVIIEAKQKDKIIFSKDTIINAEVGKQYLFSSDIKTIFNSKLDSNIQVSVDVKRNGTTLSYTNYLRTIHYDHIPDINYNFKDNIRVVTEETKTVGKNIGYITGAGDKVPQALQQMGYNVKLLGENDVTPANLAQFDAVISGIRAYNLFNWLPAKYDVLMNYIKAGGNYIVQYNQQDVVTQNIGPYPFSISRTRVTDETADVHLLLPNNEAFNYPNKITDKDFLNWIQERSIYQAQNFDAHYAAPIGMHDPNEPESNGSLIIAPYGKGNFVYTGLVFFRELPAGNAGAYRLLANLIALPKNK